jgi:hypothetical protein
MDALLKLSPAQSLLLRTAARRADGRVIAPETLRGGARTKVLPAPLDGQRTAPPHPAGAGHHPEHPGRAAAPVHEPAVVPTEPTSDRLGGAAGSGGGVRRLTGLRALDHPCHITAAFGALAHQQQVATLDGAAEIGDRGFVTALAAPDVGQQPLADICWDGFPALTGGFGESRQ